MSDKYCPMQKWSPDNTPQDMKCKEEKCSWWIRNEEQCAIASIALHQRLVTIKRDGREY